MRRYIKELLCILLKLIYFVDENSQIMMTPKIIFLFDFTFGTKSKTFENTLLIFKLLFLLFGVEKLLLGEKRIEKRV